MYTARSCSTSAPASRRRTKLQIFALHLCTRSLTRGHQLKSASNINPSNLVCSTTWRGSPSFRAQKGTACFELRVFTIIKDVFFVFRHIPTALAFLSTSRRRCWSASQSPGIPRPQLDSFPWGPKVGRSGTQARSSLIGEANKASSIYNSLRQGSLHAGKD